MIWRGTTTGEFTIRSTNHISKEHLEATHGECSVQSKLQSLWKNIWGAKVQNPLKKFIWRACHNILPTKDNLLRRGMELDPACVFCKSEPETVLHMLWTCPSASDV
jgi:hypothetical protein